MRILKLVLLPFAFFYAGIMYFRNLLFDFGIIKSRKFDLPIISVGNLSTGGTGKSPMIEYLVRLLGNHSGISILSRGYGRKTRGYVIVKAENDYTEYGDEPLQFKKKFPLVHVVVCESRVEGVEQILLDFPETKCILLDDAYQHRKIKAGLSILLIPYYEALSSPFVLPAGNQREMRSGSERADLIIVSKSPEFIKPAEMDLIRKKLLRKKSQEIFFSNFNYGKPVPMHSEAGPIDLDTFQGSILLLTGIANPGPLKEYLYGHSQKVIHASFPDHHEFFDRDLSEIQKIFNNIADSEKIIITTEKDSIRLQKFAEKSLNISNTLKLIYYIPIEVCFLADGEKDFNRKIIDYVGKN